MSPSETQSPSWPMLMLMSISSPFGTWNGPGCVGASSTLTSSGPGWSCAWGRCTMAPRLQLHNLLTEKVEHVYYQPPNSMTIEFPCILYARDDSFSEHADNRPY